MVYDVNALLNVVVGDMFSSACDLGSEVGTSWVEVVIELIPMQTWPRLKSDVKVS